MLVDEIMDAIRDLNAREALTVLLVEQAAAYALLLAHRAYVLKNGAVFLSGTAADLREDESGTRLSWRMRARRGRCAR
jgi:branched-chain amino acid transport system ATP-binding protein